MDYSIVCMIIDKAIKSLPRSRSNGLKIHYFTFHKRNQIITLKRGTFSYKKEGHVMNKVYKKG